MWQTDFCQDVRRTSCQFDKDLVGSRIKTYKELLASAPIEFEWPAQCDKIITDAGYHTHSCTASDGDETN